MIGNNAITQSKGKGNLTSENFDGVSYFIPSSLRNTEDFQFNRHCNEEGQKKKEPCTWNLGLDFTFFRPM